MCAGGQRKRRAAPRQRRQAAGAAGQEVEEDVEAEFNPENPYQVSHTHKRDFLLLLRLRWAAASQLSDQIRGLPETLFPARDSHSCASGSRCRGHGGGARIVTANLSVCVGV